MERNLDGYPPFTPDDLAWFAAQVKAYAPGRADDIKNVGRRRAGLDLELLIVVEPRSRPVFTADVCLELARKAARRTGVLEPVVYVYGDPHPAAQEAIDYAARQM